MTLKHVDAVGWILHFRGLGEEAFVRVQPKDELNARHLVDLLEGVGFTALERQVEGAPFKEWSLIA